MYIYISLVLTGRTSLVALELTASEVIEQWKVTGPQQ